MEPDELSTVLITNYLSKEMDKLAEKKTSFTNLRNKLSQITSNVSRFNIGGDHVDVKSDLILEHSHESHLFALLSGRYDHLLPKDKSGRIFLDLDARWVTPLVTYLRDLSMWNGDIEGRPNTPFIQSLMWENYIKFSELFQIKRYSLFPIEYSSNGLQALSDILRHTIPHSDSILGGMLAGVESVDPLKLEVTLLFRGSRDGFGAKQFHANCDGHRNTLSIIRDKEGNIFGGFADNAWNSGVLSDPEDDCSAGDVIYMQSPGAFLFQLMRNKVINPTQHKLIDLMDSDAMSCCENSMCSFGQGELVVSSHCDQGRHSTFHLSDRGDRGTWCYHSNGTGTQSRLQFQVSEIEVFEVDMSSLAEAAVESVKDEVDFTTPDFSLPVVKTATNCDPHVSAILQSLTDWHNYTSQRISELSQADWELQRTAIAFVAELRFVAKFVGVVLPDYEPITDVSLYQNTLNEIETIMQLMGADRQSSSTAPDASSIVTINAGGTKLAVSKATLLQAPLGSLLSKFTSEEWGHDLDGDGHIFQDVNPVFLATILSHFRLTALSIQLGHFHNIPAITVHKNERAAFQNLLSFYLLSDLPVTYSIKTDQRAI